MSAEALISRLEGVRPRGPGRWIARCPAHADKSPSLVITELQDGRVLVYCHAQCGAAAVLSAVGLDFDALFPEKLDTPMVRQKRAYLAPADVLAALDDEILAMGLVAARTTAGIATDSDRERAFTAFERFFAARRMTGALSGRS